MGLAAGPAGSGAVQGMRGARFPMIIEPPQGQVCTVGGAEMGKTQVERRARWPVRRRRPAALLAMPFVPYAGAVPDGGRHGQGGEVRRAPIV